MFKGVLQFKEITKKELTDLKSSNIMFRNKNRNEIRLIDFGGAEREQSVVKIYSSETSTNKDIVNKDDTFFTLLNTYINLEKKCVNINQDKNKQSNTLIKRFKKIKFDLNKENSSKLSNSEEKKSI